MAHESGTSSTFREPFDPMEPTEHIDSQLAALRSMMSSTSAMPPPPPSQATSSAPVLPPSMQTLSHNGPGGGLTYDAFWSTHSSKPAYRALLASHTGVQTTGHARSATPLQAHGSAPAVLTQPSSGADPRAGHTNGQNYEGRFGR
ncbi:hypothetical protein BD413DRAFT_614890 [Trametes elegans]|nr:hypothetical protein BD413DRAFT_614890 [Trametes elegans]